MTCPARRIMMCISWTCRHTSQFFRFFKAVTKKSPNESSTRSAVADFSLIDTCFKETKTSFRICERSKHHLKNLFLFFCFAIQFKASLIQVNCIL